MTITLNLKPEVEAGLLAQAQANGMTLEEYLLSMVEGAALSATQKTLSPDERASAFEAWSASHRPTPDLSDYAVSRESMYEGRDHLCVSWLTRTFYCAAPNPPILSPLRPRMPCPSCCAKRT